LRNLLEITQPCLRKGAALVVADEGHQIKNPATKIARALMTISTKKRIALTGYPLQNKLMEYYTMVNWIQKDLLDEQVDFKKTYVLPITNGECQAACLPESRSSSAAQTLK
jgi:transcriptional regulator ATRX